MFFPGERRKCEQNSKGSGAGSGGGGGGGILLWGRTKSRRVAALFLAALCSLIVVLGWEGSPASTVLGTKGWRTAHRLELEIAVTKESPRTPVFKQPDCQFHEGKWVEDSSRPLYSGKSCSQFLSGMWACRLTDRQDFEYERYRWQPDECDLPEFDGRTFLARWRSKTIAFVGDSLGRQQFQSLLCMITRGRDSSTDVVDVGHEFGFVLRPPSIRPNGWAYRFSETNTTILFYWTSSLCDIQVYNASDRSSASAMHLDRPPEFLARHLDSFSVVILNTGHHWNSGKISGNKWEMHVNGTRTADRSFRSIAYARSFVVSSIARWLDQRIRNNTSGAAPRVFMTALSPRHFMNGDWNSGGRCDNLKPFGVNYTRRPSRDLGAENAVLNTRVELLNITLLSHLRGEAHISRYSPKSKEGIQDCLHWCLPGVPDVWNELLNAQLLIDG